MCACICAFFPHIMLYCTLIIAAKEYVQRINYGYFFVYKITYYYIEESIKELHYDDEES